MVFTITCNTVCILWHTLPAFAINIQLKLFVVVVNEHLVIVAGHSITDKTSLSVARIHPQAHREIPRQTFHVRDNDSIIDSFLCKMESFIYSNQKKAMYKLRWYFYFVKLGRYTGFHSLLFSVSCSILLFSFCCCLSLSGPSGHHFGMSIAGLSLFVHGRINHATQFLIRRYVVHTHALSWIGQGRQCTGNAPFNSHSHSHSDSSSRTLTFMLLSLVWSWSSPTATSAKYRAIFCLNSQYNC